MAVWRNRLHKIKEDFQLAEQQVARIAHLFHQTVSDGLAGRKTCLKMLPSFLALPTGQEKGRYLALDFGGTNVRVIEVELRGNGDAKVLGWRSSPLRHPQGAYDYCSERATASELFDFIAGLIGELVKPGDIYALGHTFSFPSRQTDVNNAVLLHWTKEIRTRDVAGRNVTELLSAALARRGIANVEPQAVINDTVSVLLAAAYRHRSADMGSICGTGHNTAYLEPYAFDRREPMIINLETGNFDLVTGTVYDELVDRISEQPGGQRLEKMVAGRYVGELARLIMLDLVGYGLFHGSAPARDALAAPELLDGADLAFVLNDVSPGLAGIAGLLQARIKLDETTPEERRAVQEIARMVVTRAARLTAATYCGILRHVDPDLRRTHVLAVDGSLYEKMPGYATAVRTALNQGLGAGGAMVRLVLQKGGSGIGAAVAAAITAKKST